MSEQRKCPIIDGLRYEGGDLMEAAANEIERLQARVAELEQKRDGWKINYDNLRAKYKQRGEYMKDMRDVLEQCGICAKFAEWFDENGDRPETTTTTGGSMKDFLAGFFKVAGAVFIGFGIGAFAGKAMASHDDPNLSRYILDYPEQVFPGLPETHAQMHYSAGVRDKEISYQWRIAGTGNDLYPTAKEACIEGAKLALPGQQTHGIGAEDSATGATVNEEKTEVAGEIAWTPLGGTWHDLLEVMATNGQLTCTVFRKPPEVSFAFWDYTVTVYPVAPDPAECEQVGALEQWHRDVSGYFPYQLMICYDCESDTDNSPDGRYEDCRVLFDTPDSVLTHIHQRYENVHYFGTDHPIPVTEAMLWKSDLSSICGAQPTHVVYQIKPTWNASYPHRSVPGCVKFGP